MIYKDWLEFKCTNCGGFGWVPWYSQNDFEGTKGCDSCWETGRLYVTPKDIIIVYPGGPFRGKWPGKYKVEKEKANANRS